MDESRLFLDTTKLSRPLEERLVDDKGRSHMHQYGGFMHIGQEKGLKVVRIALFS